MAPSEWNTLFLALTFASSLFLVTALVAFYVSPLAWRASALRQAVALLALVVLATPLFFSLLVLMPTHPWKAAGVLVGLAGYAATANHVVEYVRFSGPVDKVDLLQVWLLVVNVAAFSILLWVPSLPWKAGTCIWMVLWGLIESWLVIGTRVTREPGRGTVPPERSRT